MQVGELFVRLGVKLDELKAGLATAEEQIRAFEKRFEPIRNLGQRFIDIGQAMSVGITLPLAAAGGAAIKFAMDAVESENLFEVSMGKMADAARAWSKQLSDALGLNEYELRRNIGTWNVMFQSMGFGEQAAYEMAQGLTQLAYDMASFYNLKPEEAFEKLRSGIAGEIEPLRQLGILVDENTVKTYAYTHGIAKAGEELTETQKVAARYGAILEQTSKAQGDLARTIESPTNQLRILRARVEELLVDIGKLLIPVFANFVKHVQNAVAWFSSLSESQKKTLVVIAGIAAALGPLTIVIGQVIKAIGVWATVMEILKKRTESATVSIGTRIAGVIGIIGVVTTAVTLLHQAWTNDWGGIQEKTHAVGQAIVAIFNSVVANIALAFNRLKEKIWGLLQGVLNALAPVANIIGKIAPGFEAGFENLRKTVAGKLADVKVNVQDLQVKVAVAGALVKSAFAGVKEAFSSWETPAKNVKKAGSDIEEAARKALMSYKALDAALVPAGERFEKAGKKGKKAGKDTKEAAEDSRAAWERAADILSTRLQIIQAQQEIAAIAAEQHGTKAQALANKLTWLNRQLEVQKEIVAAVTQGYEDSVRAKGADAEETLRLALRLEQEKKAQADIERQIYDTTQAIKDQAKELRDLAGQVAELAEEYEAVERKMRDDLAAAAEEYQRKVAEVNRKLAEDERRLTEQYEAEVERRAKTLRDFVGLFDKVTTKNVSGKELLENLRGQVKTFEEWSVNIQALAARGVDEGLIQELRKMGPKAAPEIAALNTLTDTELAEYVALWREKNRQARAEAVNQLTQQRIEMQQKLIEIRIAAQEQLEQYRIEWEKKNAEIRKNAEEEMARIEKRFKEIAEAGSKYGVSLVVNFTEAARSRFDDLRQMLEEMAAMIDSYMPHSPAKRGPLARIMEWGPALVRGLTEGIRRSLPSLEDVSARMAALSPGALAPAIAASYSTTNAYYGGNTIYIQVSGGSNASDLADQLMRELRKRGVRL